MTRADGSPPVALLRSALKSQYHAGLEMLRRAMDACPDDLWDAAAHRNPFWRVAYHALFYTHFYLQRHADDFHAWDRHQPDVHYMDSDRPREDATQDPSPGGATRFTPYSKKDLLEYWAACDALVDRAVDALDLSSAESGFYWYPISKIEHQMVNLRHLGHHTGQLFDRVRDATGQGVDWVGRTAQDVQA